MATTSKKVNELPQETPTLNDTLLGSNATKEYACKVEDLASLVGGGPMIVNVVVDPDEIEPDRLDKTWQEIYDAMADGQYLLVVTNDPEVPLITQSLVSKVNYNEIENGYFVDTADGRYVADTANDYPVVHEA